MEKEMSRVRVRVEGRLAVKPITQAVGLAIARLDAAQHAAIAKHFTEGVRFTRSHVEGFAIQLNSSETGFVFNEDRATRFSNRPEALAERLLPMLQVLANGAEVALEAARRRAAEFARQQEDCRQMRAEEEQQALRSSPVFLAERLDQIEAKIDKLLENSVSKLV